MKNFSKNNYSTKRNDTENRRPQSKNNFKKGNDLNTRDNFKSRDDSNRREDFKRRDDFKSCLLYTSPSPRDVEESRMPSSA